MDGDGENGRGTMLDLVRTNVERRYGQATWAALLGRVRAVEGVEGNGASGLGARRGQGTDANAPSDALACWLGRQAVARAARDWPDVFERNPDLRALLLGLDGHTAGPASSGHDEASLAVRVHPAVDRELFVTVDGDGACCALIEGLIAGAAEHYGERIRLELLKCCKWGDNRCVIRVGFDAVDSQVDYRFAPLSAAEPTGRRVRVV